MPEDVSLNYRIALTLIPGIGDVNGKKLVAYCGGAEAVFREKKKNLLKIPGVGEAIANAVTRKDIFAKAEKEAGFIRQYQITPLFYLDPEYPDRLKHCEDGPMMIYFKGKADLCMKRILSVVGTRMPTDYGKAMCEQVIQDFSGQGVMIVSGLAYGVDTAAHRAALAAGLPTVGVLAHGLDQIYPFVNRPLAEKMVENGGLLTEFLSGTSLNRDYFPRRNRIIAGIADATLVIESAMKGGALITADIANSYSRDVFALPGRATDAKSCGCNQLIKTNKAALIHSAADISYMMGWDRSPRHDQVQQKLFSELTEQEKVILGILDVRKEAGIDEIYLNSGMTASKVASILLKLEFDGIVRSMPGKRYKLND
ncbi:MAG: DNA-processing protein DprA [Bacteroidales bacterium]|jgi:DNA processing protein|nr:DNA-processing protein DprA [Bacteroidales bacterium]